ncbi:NAD(P)/FAD-dependent oxidoreductase [Actinomadura alba]|uniref:NAD(P)/FAD-dependent oxidoreductase n=1 Tax=Actinomadura alba TaxID=406431 RepID=A0ABR7M010_9ACTN|nr:FAD/NAD(P)-binding oxidoreductase [Actinomadura alba]MBC6470268.1 NAD(P)/FAD-dependent oxidoreductase [Actinomadura alba]
MPRTVAVLGAGVGGLMTAHRLRGLLSDADRIVLIDRTLTSSLGLSSLWVLRGWRRPEDVQVRIAPSRLPGVELVEHNILAIDPDRRTVTTSALEISYDALVIALGSELDAAATPGLAGALNKGSAHEFYTLAGAERLRRRLEKFDGGRVVVAIAGVPFKCPAAPFEAALLAADLLRSADTPHPTQVDTFTPDPLPMPVAGPAVGEGLAAMLKQYEIGFFPNRVITSIHEHSRQLCFADGQCEEYDVLAVVPRHRPPRVVADLDLSQVGWVPVDARTLTTGLDGIWALGDVTVLTLPNGKPLPKAAVFAEGQAEAVAYGIAHYFGLPAPEPWFDGSGSCYIEIGGHMAAKGEGEFLADSAPAVTLHEPSTEFHDEKRAQETDWLRRWSR